MNDYVLLTDSSADLTDALVKELGVEVLPLSFTMRNKTYRNWPDNREIDPKDFYRQLREGEMATTSAVNVSDFTETIEPHLKEGRDVLVVAFSSGLSATCHSAQIAAQELSEQYPERKVYVVDSLCASLGQGLLVWYAARMKNEGRGIGAVRDWLEEKYPGWNDTFGKVWDVLIDNFAHGREDRTVPGTLPMICNVSQLPIVGTPSRTLRDISIVHEGRRYHFGSEVDKWIFEDDPERYRHHRNLVDRFLGGDIQPADLPGVLEYMGLGTVGPGGDDAHGFAWVDSYRKKLANAAG